MLLAPDPIIAQLLPVKLGPIENQPEGPARELSFDESQRLDPDFRFMLAVYRMEMRRRVIVVIHSNDDPKEDAECWHERSRYASTLRNPQQKKLLEVNWMRNARLAEVVARSSRQIGAIRKQPPNFSYECRPISSGAKETGRST